MKVEYSNLDFLRAFAVTMVVICHVSSFYGHSYFGFLGFMGVMLFFIHTCMVLMQSLEREPAFASFLIRRCFRIYPLALFALAVVIAFRIPQGAIVSGAFHGWNYGVGDVISNLLLTQGIFGILQSIIGPMWSLSYEMQMYLLLPAIYALIRTASMKKVLAIWLAVAIASTVVCRVYPLTTLFAYAPCFMSGAVAYKLAARTRGTLKAALWPLLLFGVTGVLLAGWLSKPFLRLQLSPVGAPFDAWWVVCAFVGLALPFFGQLTMPAIIAPAKMLAKYSYGIYVSHFFCMWVALQKMSGFSFPVRMAAFILLLAAVSLALYYGIERPFINLGRRMADRIR